MTDPRARMKELRQRRGLSQRKFAKVCDDLDKKGVWPQSKICRIEAGKMALTVEDLAVIVKALGTTLPLFFRERRAA